MIFAQKSILFWIPSLKTQQPILPKLSVSGAGDCLSAGFIAGILNGKDHNEALLMGLKAARLSLLSMDTVPESLNMQNVLE